MSGKFVFDKETIASLTSARWWISHTVFLPTVTLVVDQHDHRENMRENVAAPELLS